MTKELNSATSNLAGASKGPGEQGFPPFYLLGQGTRWNFYLLGQEFLKGFLKPWSYIHLCQSEQIASDFIWIVINPLGCLSHCSISWTCFGWQKANKWRCHQDWWVRQWLNFERGLHKRSKLPTAQLQTGFQKQKQKTSPTTDRFSSQLVHKQNIARIAKLPYLMSEL